MKAKLAIAVRNAILGATGAVTLATTLPALAQDDTVEEISVTGSRIRGTELVGTAVMVMDRDDMADTGGVTIDRMLKEIPQNFNLGVSDASRSQSGGAGNIVYSNSVNLRGIGAYATLILVDGHRAISNSRSVDPSMLPSLGVGRIEVIADGSSAIYGSDAVAGVVNIIPRRNLDGVEAFARYGTSDDSGYTEKTIGAAWGKNWGDAEMMLAIEKVDRSRLYRDDRDFSANTDLTSQGGGDYRINRCQPGNIILPSGVSYAIPAGGITQANAGSLVAGTENLCNTGQGQDLTPAQNYTSINSTGSYDLNDRLTLSYDGFYSERKFDRAGGVYTTNFTVPSTNAWFVRPDGFTGNSYTVAYNGAGEVPLSNTVGSATNWEISPAFNLALNDNWELEGVFTYGKNEDESNRYRDGDRGAVPAAVNSSDPNSAFDPYGLDRTTDATKDAIFNNVFFAPTHNDFIGYQLSTNGTLFELPAGPVGLAAGYERQELDVRLGLRTGNPVDTNPLTWRAFSREVDSVYTEVVIPISDSGSSFGRVDVTAALRYDDYSDAGDTTNHKLGISWQPTDNLKLRASHGTSFRASIIPDIYGNTNAIRVGRINDPTVGNSVDFAGRTGPNLDLKPEEATTWSVGADWNITDSLTANLTYFDVEYEGKIENATGNPGILSLETEYVGTPVIKRGAAAISALEALLLDPEVSLIGRFPGDDINNIQVFVDQRNFNLGVSETKGFDLQLSYTMDTNDLGSFRFSTNTSYLTDYDVAISASGTPISLRNIIYQPAKLKSRGTVSWDMGNWRSFISVNYLNSYTNNLVLPNESVDSYMPMDLRVAYSFDGSNVSDLLQDLEVSVEVRNFNDEQPPFVDTSGGGYDVTATNPVGRFFALSLRKSFF